VNIASRIACGPDTGSTWIQVVKMVACEPERKLLHVRARITHPGLEDPSIREVADTLLQESGHPPVTTVINTLFPAALAKVSATPKEFVSRYRAMYKRIRREARINNRGTYFGRLIDYPGRDGPVDQLSRLIKQLHKDNSQPNRPRAIYENTTTTVHDADTDSAGLDDNSTDAENLTDGTEGLDLRLYAPTPDTIPMSFPCLSHLSFQRDGHRLHLLAHYRSQYLVRRAYGNYLALGLLQTYIADATGMQVGELTVDTGLVTLDSTHTRITRHLSALDQLTLL
jgi:hypothetical protein